jgi:hypothetical protein
MPRRRRQKKADLDLEKLSPDEKTRLAVAALLKRGMKARSSIADFYRMVIRHELTKEILQPAPHQELMFSFVEDHERVVIRQPIGTGKTFGMAAVTLWLLGNDVTHRGAIVSKTQSQAVKVLRMVKDYITEPALNQSLQVVFPWLIKSPRADDPWQEHQATVERPPGIRDPSMLAVGVDGAIGGARLSWIVADDTIDTDNSATPAGREKLHSNFESRILSRLDPQGSRAVVTNTPWDRQDLTYSLEGEGWPTLQMDIYGNIRFVNASPEWVEMALDKFLRPSELRGSGWYRLKAHDADGFDHEEKIPLWPDRWSAEKIHEIRYGKDGQTGMLPHEFARVFLCEPFDEDAARCQRDWIEDCKRRGEGLTLVDSYEGSNPTYTGVDLGVGLGKPSAKSDHDLTVFFTFERLKDGSRRLLDIESGRFTGPKIVEKLVKKAEAFKSLVMVENNAAQDYIRQFALKEKRDLRVKAHTTNQSNKRDLDFGVESIFTEFQQKAWIIPCERHTLKTEKEVTKWLDACVYYQPPPAHTDDRLMASWFAREGCRKGRGGRDPRPTARGRLKMASGGSF